MAHDRHEAGDGSSAGVLAGLLLLIIVASARRRPHAIVLLSYFGPNVFNVNLNIRRWLEALTVT